ncbi:ABC transporter substrate-binding protein [Mycetocola zhadangensis]|uniref:ABC transporter substrate-binding protein n=1 Tax=Mycetocola zhadangensis TaxID=1164595 RepID=A0A3L7IWN4_9MICO|nr:ABC transporter substrate-binding protein [Mycetocola zhadangensis]RLQ82638.1 ABC transporter substrate-binding protein [Mycetocola zhadangensis]GGE99602.1 peptide ABC transporter [Mycetocola zhadangensis]
MPVTRGRSTLGLALLMSATLLSGCASGSAAEKSSTGDPVDGGTLALSISTEPGCLDSHSISATQHQLLGRIIYDNLVTLDEDGNIAPYLAKSWDISEDGKTYTFTLEEGVTFSDGSPWNAEVLGQNFEHMRDPATKSPLAAAYIAPYVDGTVIDEYTFEAHLSYAYTPFLYNLAQSWLAMTSGKAITESPETLCQAPVGSGPFVVEDYKVGQSISYVKREGYNWGPDWLGYDGEAHLDGIEITVVPEAVIRYETLVSGQYDITENLPPQNAAAIEANDAFVYENLIRAGSPYALSFNLSRAPFDDIRVREAFVAAVDRDAVTDSVGFGTYTPKDNFLSSKTPYYDETTEGKLDYDPDQANDLLDEAGWTVKDSDGYRTKDGKRLTVVVPTVESATPSALLVQLQGEVKKVGIELKVDQYPQAQLTEIRYAGDYDGLAGVWHTNTPDVLFIRHHSSEITGERIGQNSSYLSDPELDELLQASRGATDGDEAREAYSKAQHRLLELVPGLPLYENPSQWAYAKNTVQGIVTDTSHPVPVFTSAWLDR